MFGRRPTASSTCEPIDLRRPVACSRRRPRRRLRAARRRMHSALVRTAMPSASRMLADRLGDVLVLAPDQPRRHLDDRHLGAEAPIHLREFEADVAAADDDEMPRHAVEREHRRVGEIRHVARRRACRAQSRARRR